MLAVHRGQAGEQIADIDLGIVAVAQAGDDDGVEDGSAEHGVVPIVVRLRGYNDCGGTV